MMFSQELNGHRMNIQATTCSKDSDQTARMRRLIWGFAGRTDHIVENFMKSYKGKWNIKKIILKMAFYEKSIDRGPTAGH